MPQVEWLLAGLVGIYGLLVGSFLNAWIWRTHTKRKISRGRSICPHCHTQLHWYELIPVISWLGLKGRCRTCHKPISIQYPLVESGTALLWVALYLKLMPASVGSWLELIVWLAIVSLLIAALVYDARWQLLPDIFTMPVIALALILLIAKFIGHGLQAVEWQIVDTIAVSGSFWLLWRLSGGKLMGEGDIYLAALLGLLLSPAQLLIALAVAFDLGAIVGVSLIALKKKTRRDPIAFGPFLIIGLMTAYLLGDALVRLYWHLLS